MRYDFLYRIGDFLLCEDRGLLLCGYSLIESGFFNCFGGGGLFCGFDGLKLSCYSRGKLWMTLFY